MRTVSKTPGRGCAAPLAVSLLLISVGPAVPSRHAVRHRAHARRIHHRGVYHGLASWYGRRWQGRRTAFGERFNRHAATLASRGLPYNTLVRVTNLHNGRSALGRVNDRGPYVRGRIVDLSEALARRVGMRERGIARVRVEVLRAGNAP
jgi:rare lipoprotein A (peptidoglycan hydrolase)